MNAATITSSITPLIQGFLLCVSIIVAFGPQNLFILRQGLQRQHLFATALFSSLADLASMRLPCSMVRTPLLTARVIASGV